MGTNVKCRYANCEKLHPSRIVSKSEALLYGRSTYYHPDCYEYSRNIQEIKVIFYNQINRNVVMSELGRIINKLIFERGFDPAFVKFAVEYCVELRPGKLQYPAGLYYIVEDKEIKKAWSILNAPKIDEDSFAVGKGEEDYEVSAGFVYKPTGSSGFGDILM